MKLREITAVRQIEGEQRRRWFTCLTMDVIVWLDQAGAPAAFQFCYDKGRREQAISWKPGSGLSQMGVDDGETGDAIRYKSTPMLMPRQELDLARARALLEAGARELPRDISDFMLRKLK